MWSWWNSLSLETLGSLNTYAQWAMAVFGFLTAVAMVASIMASARISSIKDAQLSALKQEQTATKEEVTAVREQQEPRALNTQQRAKVLEILRAEPKGTISVLGAAMGDGEALTFATELRQLLQSAGWGVEAFAANWASTWNPVGVILIVRTQEEAPAYAGTLQRAFRAADITAEEMLDAKIQVGSLRLIVGHKPN